MSDWGIGALAVVVAFNTLFIGAIAAALFFVHRKLVEIGDQVEPVAARATQTLAKVEQVSTDLQQRTDAILERATTLVETVSRRVDQTTELAEETISEPLIEAASVMAGVRRGLQVYREQAKEKGVND